MKDYEIKGILIILITIIFGAIFWVMLDYIPKEISFMALIPIAVLGASGLMGIRIYFGEFKNLPPKSADGSASEKA